ncbi:uncharacterized protein LOC121382232 [Gigantopelta aegis]|uniref:uncharacterized protein LOC121382232 n=1 Tax=Gigantopelta aegis TaxID=1735272 RepID=UPI001B887B8F|nr:uncharacterized protein LOC121382232 [Gigantopelta aegis]
MFVKIGFFHFRRNSGMYLLFQLISVASVLDLVQSPVCEEEITFIRDDLFSNLSLKEAGVENQAKCAVICDRLSDCKLFFFHKNSGKCQTNSVIYLSTAGSVDAEGFVYFRKEMECPVPPSVPHSHPQFDVNSPPTATGTALKYTCDVGYTPQGSVRCQVDGTWSQLSYFKAGL